ncbi:protein lacX, plasmid, putative [Entamoeba invadens IP1]|uniref:Protein lacX, plasmid, putative n=1 Tax=Entamoeba invadens IP1 TaxID=370355 RepID=A0A0A1UCT3_ENTIV|nr:protein lacX, plasmid, putative [Entamoeba invadens IP1]ELP93734.1 protein lacX, plasmid, putative [Entamoeba invadens IP1]|eukprot:XP_004260505.1 protein lacX, plasmid, putative [Entamoeba invadens IP1]
MSYTKLSNSELTVLVSSKGAELTSVIQNSTQREYLWQADPKYWKRHSPVLFPIVGSLWGGKYTYEGKVYEMSQHGFARDSSFECRDVKENEAKYRLIASEETKKKYPFDFDLEITYKLCGSSITVKWTVTNPSSDKPLYFQIGAHPAFNYKDHNEECEIQSTLLFEPKRDDYTLTTLSQKGCVKEEKQKTTIEGGVVKIRKDTFNCDTLIFEDSQIKTVALVDKEQKPYVKVTSEAPVFGFWSPAVGKYAPFVCLEPWFGRCDTEYFDKNFDQKPWMQCLEPNKKFEGGYCIEIL